MNYMGCYSFEKQAVEVVMKDWVSAGTEEDMVKGASTAIVVWRRRRRRSSSSSSSALQRWDRKIQKQEVFLGSDVQSFFSRPYHGTTVIAGKKRRKFERFKFYYLIVFT